MFGWICRRLKLLPSASQTLRMTVPFTVRALKFYKELSAMWSITAHVGSRTGVDFVICLTNFLYSSMFQVLVIS